MRESVESFTSSITKFFSKKDQLSNNARTPHSDLAAEAAALRQSELASAFIGDETKIQSAPAPAALSPAKSPQSQAQKSAALRDPFIPFFSNGNNSRGSAGHPLTKYPLKELRATAIIGDSTGHRSASVEASDGKSFIVRVGTRVGDHGGRVERITPTTIFIVEPSDLANDSVVSADQSVTRELSLKTAPTPAYGLVESK